MKFFLALFTVFLIIYNITQIVRCIVCGTEKVAVPFDTTDNAHVLEYKDNTIIDDNKNFIIPYKQNIEITFSFKQITSMNGFWAGSEPKLTAGTDNNYISIQGETNTKSWGDTIYNSVNHDFTPSMRIIINFDQSYYHKQIHAVASFVVIYPEEVNVFDHTFSNKSNSLSRNINFFVVSPEEYDPLLKNQYAKDCEAMRSDVLLNIIAIPLLLLFLFALSISTD